MNPQTLKRPTEDVYSSGDDEYDMGDTWVNKKKSRYLYTYKLKSPDDLFENINDSDQSESIDSTQSKATIEVADILDFSSNCPSDCDCDSQDSSQSDCDSKSSSQSESEVVSDNDIFLNIDNGYIPDTDVKVFIPETDFKFPVIFKKCCICQKPNSNYYFQYCNQCFKHRMQFFESTPNPKPKSIKRLYNMTNRTVENYLPRDCQESSSTSNSQESLNSLGISTLCLSQDNTSNAFENTTNTCNICFLKPKNGIFNHGKTAHVYCCYTCAKHIWSRSGKCPICNLKIRYVTKAVHA
ncbi:E3 ubiquitin-protein ligase Mdm2-like [Rhopalosiphum maidis]|uniref:E3 ubiquitin-protein ligase Mdm2-like n=1 Tax=Rhopalosiphum maidis TaxID=43146 RepID=UPI000EFF136D|nr:E3 ubiquitin-protein ligase Mdm2-like [Rhopalosiphum maidis]XP_026806854.1 E3 ubiquitin-protein ligase Mdm2-like [Rhopalosiphum maidis]